MPSLNATLTIYVIFAAALGLLLGFTISMDRKLDDLLDAGRQIVVHVPHMNSAAPEKCEPQLKPKIPGEL